MISLILHSKMRCFEDAVTAALFDAIEVHEATATLREWLGTVRSVSGVAFPQFEFDSVISELWPSLPTGEPDVALRFVREGRVTASVLVESKIGAAKSGNDGSPSIAEFKVSRTSGDQLARYLRGFQETLPIADNRSFLGIIYLTHHASPPIEELNASVESPQLAECRHLRDVIYWSSWRDVDGILARHASGASSAWARQCSALSALLRHVGLFRFAGQLPVVPLLPEALQYDSNRSAFLGVVLTQPPEIPRQIRWPTIRSMFACRWAIPPPVPERLALEMVRGIGSARSNA